MKKILFFALACEVVSNCIAQIQVTGNINSTAKWEITPSLDAIGKGRLNVNYPVTALWTILIASPGDKQTLKYVTSANYPVELTPGNYYIEFTNVPIGIVPFKLGMQTRLRTGIIHVISEGTWTIYDKSKKTYYKTGTTPQKIILPVGGYQVNLKGKFKTVVIKDGELVEVSSSGIKTVSQAALEQTVLDVLPYRISPIQDSVNNSKHTTGLLWLIPSQQSFIYQINYSIQVFKAGTSSVVFQCTYGSGSSHCFPNTTLPGGHYDISISANYTASGIYSLSGFNPLFLRNIPIRNGYETKLNYGYLQNTPNNGGLFQVFDESNQVSYHRFLSGGKVPYPVGKYVVKHFFVGEFPVQVKEGETTIINSIDSNFIAMPKWKTQPRNLSKLSPKGRLNTDFPGNNNVQLVSPNRNLDTVKYIDLTPGSYQLRLNGVMIDVLIEPDQEKILKYGYLKLEPGDHPWEVKTLSGTRIQQPPNGSLTMPLPIGYYRVAIRAKAFLVKINESATTVFNYSDLFND